MRTVGVKLPLDTSQYVSGLVRAGTATKDFAGQLDKASKAGKLGAVADQAARFGVAGVAAFGLVVKSAAEFDKQMSAVSAATHASSQEIGALRAAALQAGKDTQYSATEAAKGITELSKAGVSTADILGGGLKGALSLAAAGQLAVGDAAEIAASALTQFKLSGSQVPHVADLLAAAAGKAQGSVADMGLALNQSGLVAAQFGLSIEDTTGVLAEFASAGLTGSDAGTSLKTMLLALANPTTQTRNLMKELGVSFYDATGKFIGFNGVATVLQTRLKGLTDAQRQQALGQIFGNDAIRSASILYTDGAAGVEKWKNAVNDAGYASGTASKLTDNLAGDIERLKGSVETLAISSGSGANGGLRVLVQGLNAVVNQFLSLPPAVGSGVTVLAGVAGAAALALAGFVKLRKGVGDAVEQLNGMGPAGEKAAGVLGKVAGGAGKAAAAFVVWETAMAAAAAIQGDTATNVDALTAGLTRFGQGAQLSGEAARVLGGNLDNLKPGFKFLADTGNDRRQVVRGLQQALEKVTPGLAGYAKSLTNTQAEVTSVDQSLASMVTSGNAQQAAAAFQRLSSALAVNGVSLDEVKAQFPAYAAAVEAAGGSTKKLGDASLGTSKKMGDITSALDVGAAAQDKYATVADAAAGAARGEAAALTALSAKLKAQTDPVFALLDAEKGLKDAQNAAAAATRKHGRNSDEAREATRKLALAAITMQGAAGTAAQTMDGRLSPALRTTLHNAGLTKAQIADVAGQFRKAKTDADAYDGRYVAKVDLAGEGPVIEKLVGMSKLQQALAKGTAVPIKNPAAFFHGLSEGGWTGPGDKYQPAGIVHADEFVIQKGSRQRIESTYPGLLDTMNRTGSLPEQVADATPGYAGGGRVWPYPVNASRTKIPDPVYAGPAGGGQTYKWIERAVASAFPGLHAISGFRPGAVTLTGNRSYHAVGRAVDYPASKALAEWVNAHYFAQTRELITPWNSLNIWNGRRHTYTGAVWRQHNFAGGNAHDHWAMLDGGVIPEPVFGVGASGRTYSFAEDGRPERVLPHYATATAGTPTGGATVTKTVTVAPVINVNGANQSPKQIALAVNRELGSLVDYYSRGN